MTGEAVAGGLQRPAARDRGRRGGGPSKTGATRVVDLARVRIERALVHRTRYRYVRPHVEREGAGWRIVSPNCSRSIDPRGGEIAIAWLVPSNEGLWLLHARDHALGCWKLVGAGLTLQEALEQVCEDRQRRFWT